MLDSEGNLIEQIYDIDGNKLITHNIPTAELSFNFYDAKQRLVCAISPKGIKQLFGTPTVAFSDIHKTSFKYNHRGWLIESTDQDGGTTKNMYANDGKLRFSQDANQKINGTFSYIQYDLLDRPIESGLFTPSVTSSSDYSFGSTNLVSTLEYGVANYDLSLGGAKSEVISSLYDTPEPNAFTLVGRKQEFLMGHISYTQRDGGNYKTWYSYDSRDRIIWMAVYNHNLDAIKTIDYSYTPAGKIAQIIYQKGNTTEQFYHQYTYDNDNRLVGVSTTNSVDANGNPINWTKRAGYKYYLHGPLKRIELGVSGGVTASQGIDYLYTPQGWLKSINGISSDPGRDGTNNFDSDLFSMSLEYFNGDYVSNGVTDERFTGIGTNHYNGLVKGMIWNATRPASLTAMASPTANSYTYDSKYQLVNSDYGTINGVFSPTVSNFETFSYDENGNLQTLTRKDPTGASYHNFAYTYAQNKPNQLISVSNYTNQYAYNAIGQMISRTDNNAATNNYTYDSRGLMTNVSGSGAFEYDDRNFRALKSSRFKGDVYIRDLSGNILAVYEGNRIYSPDGNSTINYSLSEVPIYGLGRIGLFYPSGVQASYELNDHLGNVRLTFSEFKNGGVINIAEYAEYYSHGLPIPGLNQKVSPFYRFGYQGQFSEFDQETNLNHFELRDYDPAMARWLLMDPFRQYFNPYLGMGNNPIITTDPNGGTGCENCPTFFHHLDYWTMKAHGTTDAEIKPPLKAAGGYAEAEGNIGHFGVLAEFQSTQSGNDNGDIKTVANFQFKQRMSLGMFSKMIDFKAGAGVSFQFTNADPSGGGNRSPENYVSLNYEAFKLEYNPSNTTLKIGFEVSPKMFKSFFKHLIDFGHEDVYSIWSTPIPLDYRSK